MEIDGINVWTNKDLSVLWPLTFSFFFLFLRKASQQSVFFLKPILYHESVDLASSQHSEIEISPLSRSRLGLGQEPDWRRL